MMRMTERGYWIGDRLYQTRHARALTQMELAEISSVHHITISDIERGRRAASARTLRKLAAALDVDVKEFIDSDLT